MTKYYCKKTGNEIKLKPLDIIGAYHNSMAGYAISIFTACDISHVAIVYPKHAGMKDKMLKRNWIIESNPPRVQMHTLSGYLQERKCALLRCPELWKANTKTTVIKNANVYLAPQIDRIEYGTGKIFTHAWDAIKGIFGADTKPGHVNPNDAPICSELIDELYQTKFNIQLTNRNGEKVRPVDISESKKIEIITEDLGVMV